MIYMYIYIYTVMYICDFETDISITHVCILMEELCFELLIFKNISLTLRDPCKELRKPSVTKTYSVGFNHDAELTYKK